MFPVQYLVILPHITLFRSRILLRLALTASVCLPYAPRLPLAACAGCGLHTGHAGWYAMPNDMWCSCTPISCRLPCLLCCLRTLYGSSTPCPQHALAMPGTYPRHASYPSGVGLRPHRRHGRSSSIGLPVSAYTHSLPFHATGQPRTCELCITPAPAYSNCGKHQDATRTPRIHRAAGLLSSAYSQAARG